MLRQLDDTATDIEAEVVECGDIVGRVNSAPVLRS
jgi:hypothetical protein